MCSAVSPAYTTWRISSRKYSSTPCLVAPPTRRASASSGASASSPNTRAWSPLHDRPREAHERRIAAHRSTSPSPRRVQAALHTGDFDPRAALVIALHDRQSLALPWTPTARVELTSDPTQRRERDGDHACMARSVLVVDDDPEFRELAGRLLAASGLAVVGGAGSVAEALVAAVRLKPAAVLVDVELPDGDGIALARELAALAWHPRVVLTSIDPAIATTEEARNAGARAFVNKADLPNVPLAQLLGGE